MTEFVPKGTGNSRYLKSVSNFLTQYPTYADFAAALIAGTLPVDFNGINAAGVIQEGTQLSKANLLSDETAEALGLTGEDPTVNDALASLAGQGAAFVKTFAAADWTAGTEECTITIPATEHGMSGSAVTCQAASLSDGAYYPNTWAARETYATISSDEITLHCSGTSGYAGLAVLGVS